MYFRCLNDRFQWCFDGSIRSLFLCTVCTYWFIRRIGVGLKRLVKKRYTTLLLDKYNTSKKCCHCWKDIHNITIDGSKKFRLFWCKHCRNYKEEHIGSREDEPKSMFQSYLFFTWDKNSCLKMLGIVKHMIYTKNKRPVEFIRD